MKKILIIGFSDLNNDPRVNRQIRYLKDEYRVSTIGLNKANVEGVTFYELKKIPRSRLTKLRRAVGYKLKRFDKMYWSLYDFDPLLKALQDETFDLILANDPEALPLAMKIAKGAKILLDAHEYTPLHFSDLPVWRFFFQEYNIYLCKEYLHRCDGVITVNSSIAREYKKNFGIESQVITNAAEYFDLKPSPVAEDKIRVITHGNASPNRRLESMIEIIDHLDDRFHFDLMLMPVFPKYYKKIAAMAEKRDNVAVIPPVPMHEIVPFTNSYDMSFIIFKPYTINYLYGLPNKFFESIQARLMIVSGTSPEPQVEIMKEYNLGLVAETYETTDIARQLNNLSASDIMEYKNNCHIAASQLTTAKNMDKLKGIIANLLASG